MAFAISAGSLSGLARPAAGRAASVALTADLTMDYAALWRTQGAVRTVVDFLGRAVSECTDEEVVVTTTLLADMLRAHRERFPAMLDGDGFSLT